MFGKRSPSKPDRRDKVARRAARRERAIEQFVVEEIEVGDVGNLRAAAHVVDKVKEAPRQWATAASYLAAWTLLWVMLVLASLYGRAAWPTDETRLLALAWEMTQGGWLVPRINGEPASQAPLLLWVIVAGWKLFGVTEGWARLAPALFGFGNLLLTWRLARRFWPDNQPLALHAPLILLGMFAWALFTTLALIDMTRVFFVLLAWSALLIQWRARDMRAWMLLGAAIGFGLLSSGLLFLIYVLPAAVLAPLWITEGVRPRWKYWYVDLLKACVLGALVFGIWLLLAARATDAAYVLRFFSLKGALAPLDWFAARQPIWWYLLLLPLATLPWSVWPLLYLRLWGARRLSVPAGLMFALVTGACVLGLLSAVDPKQPQYLLPLLPACALAVAWLLFEDELRGRGDENPLTGMTLPIALLGSALAVLPKLPRIEWLPEILQTQSPLIGVGVIALGVALAWLPLHDAERRSRSMVMLGVSAVVIIVLGVGSQFDAFNRVDETGRYLGGLDRAGRPIAHVGAYPGTYQFAGRLRRPISELSPSQVPNWLSAHPDGYLITYSGGWLPPVAVGARAVFEAPFGEQQVKIWEASAALDRGVMPAAAP